LLAALHREPGSHWTLDKLAIESAASRSVVAERFSRFLGEPPLAYLARWRLQLAARLLKTTRNTVLQIASEVGYESEAAFNRAFKRELGAPPGQFRKAVSDRESAEPGRPGARTSEAG
jgi:AraC-like DNA-binding protein